jgi:hypothetical protein
MSLPVIVPPRSGQRLGRWPAAAARDRSGRPGLHEVSIRRLPAHAAAPTTEGNLACAVRRAACAAERSRPQGRPRHVLVATTATPTTATAAGHRMVLPAPLTGHRRRPEGKLRAGSAAEGVRDWPGLVLGHQPLHVTRVGSLSCLADGAYWVLLAWILHLPPSAVPLVSDVRFRRSAQRLAWLT